MIIKMAGGCGITVLIGHELAVGIQGVNAHEVLLVLGSAVVIHVLHAQGEAVGIVNAGDAEEFAGGD